VTHQAFTRKVVGHTKSVPITAAEKQVPCTVAGTSATRQDSSRSRDVDESPDSVTPRSSDIRRRQRRIIDLGLTHSSRPTSRVNATGKGVGDSRSSAADSGSVARPIQSGSLARRAVVQEVTTPNIDERPRHSSGDVTRRVGWSPDGSDGPSATAGRDQRQTVDSVDSQPLRGSDENGDSRALRPTSPDHCSASRTATGGGPSCRARLAMTQRQPTFTQQRRPLTTTIRPSTTSKSAKTTGVIMTKSVSQPSFLAMLVAGTAVTGRDAGPSAGARGHLTAKTRNTTRADNNVEYTANNDDENNNNEEEEDDNGDDGGGDDDDDDELKRQRIHDWLQHLETVVLDRPHSPVIDEDVPLQTDTAIHIVYEGD